MFKNNKKAFTLAEIFIAMIILGVLVSLCMTFFVNKNNYEREYYYYSIYSNLVKAVDSALFNEHYKTAIPEGTANARPARTSLSTCGTLANPSKCNIFASNAQTLCQVLKDSFNSAKVNCGNDNVASTFANITDSNYSIKLINGMLIYFVSQSPDTISVLQDATLSQSEYRGYTIFVDLDGRTDSKNRENYDIVKFYITLSGKVIPDYGSVSGIRGYNPAAPDASGNAALISFDAIYHNASDNNISILTDGRSVPFPVAACKTGYISENTSYCQNAISAGSGVTKDATCNGDAADCNIRLVKKMQRFR